jgi:hypothetical protein
MPIDPDNYITEAPGQTPGGTTKFIKISVPNFASATNPMGSYLRLGSTEDDITPGAPNTPPGTLDPSGEDLASLVQGFADDMRDRGQSTDQPPSPPETLPLGDVTPPGGTWSGDPSLSTGDRVMESGGTATHKGNLHTKGGWRDHSDGNRITTTRGDKVEVIRGNYKMVVLGRQDDIANAAGWDVSGGLVDTADLAMPTNVAHGIGNINNIYDVEYKWEKDSNGRWGWTQQTITGSHNTAIDPLDTANPAGPPGNGRQISITWVDEMKSFVGGPLLVVGSPQAMNPVYTPESPRSPSVMNDGIDAHGNKRVNFIYNRTWVNVLDEATDAAVSIREVTNTAGSSTISTSTGKDQTETYNINGTHTVNTNVGVENDTLTASGDVTQRVSGTNVSTSTSATATFSEETVCSMHTASNFFQVNAELDAGFLSCALNVTLLLLEIKLFQHHDIHGLAHFDVHTLMHNDLHLGPHLTIDVMPSTEIYAAPKTDVGITETWLKALFMLL